MNISNAGPYEFTYNKDESFETNFSLWSQLNTEERLAFGEQPYSRKEQEEIFSNLFSEKA
tara:strand:+ start:4672 stop:4851 length:180 start_codon:yes stop_codon:yes gene_type:complete